MIRVRRTARTRTLMLPCACIALCLTGCAAKSTVFQTVEKFRTTFLADCHRIETLYEGIAGSGYSLADGSGESIALHVDLNMMVSWLEECGADLGKVKQIIE